MTTLHRALQVFLWAFAVVYLVGNSLQITQVDLWWQLADGLSILRHWAVPAAPVAAFGLPAVPFTDEYAGYETVLALIYKIGGFVGLWITFAAVYMAIALLPSASKGRYPSFDFYSTLAFLLAGILLKLQTAQRPDFVAGLLLVFLMAVLRSSDLAKITPWTIAAIFLIFLAWTNTHSTFVIGLFVLGLWIADEVGQRWRSVSVTSLLLRRVLPVFAIALLATILNPYGLRRLLLPFTSITDPGSIALSPEMWPITDYNSLTGRLVIAAIALLAWGLITNRGRPIWLTLFSIVTVLLTSRHFRFVTLLVIALLFVYAERRDEKRADSRSALTLIKSVGLGAACLFLFFGAAFNLLTSYAELSAEDRLGTHTPRFAPALAAIKVTNSTTRIPILCADNVGSYLSFDENSQFRPLIDSGLGHFSSDTKRYYFFLNQRPESLMRALADLHVSYVLINNDTMPWIPTLEALPDWKCIDWDANGMLWQRAPVHVEPIVGARLAHLTQTIRQVGWQSGSAAAFTYSTLAEDPAFSLDLLEQYDGDWPDSLFNSVCAWVDRLPPDVVQTYLSSDHPRNHPLVDAILASRLGPDAFAKFLATQPAGSRPWFGKWIEARDALRRGDDARAKTIFDSISPVPISSASYYELRYAIYHSGKNESNDDGLSAYGQWQTCGSSAEADAFIDSMSTQLNERLGQLARQPPR